MLAWTHGSHLFCRPCAVAPARRSPSLSTIDGRLPPGHIEPDAAGGANLQVDRAFEPRPCPEPSGYCRAPLSDARLPGRSSASEAVGKIALWRYGGLRRWCASADLAGALDTHCLHCTPAQLQQSSGVHRVCCNVMYLCCICDVSVVM